MELVRKAAVTESAEGAVQAETVPNVLAMQRETRVVVTILEVFSNTGEVIPSSVLQIMRRSYSWASFPQAPKLAVGPVSQQ